MFRRYPMVRQNDGSDCGAAALASVSLFYRRPVGLEQVRILAGTDRVGTNLWALSQAAEQLGFSARAVKGPYEALREIPLPAIAHVKTEEGLGHFIVLYRVGKRSVVVCDPARGRRTLSREEFTTTWTGCILILTPESTSRFNSADSTTVSSWRRFVRLLSCHKPTLF